MKGYGMANLEFNTPITPSTIFHLASVSKQFTAYCIYLLESEGKLKIDDPVKKYLPEFRDYKHPITIRNLLQHTSGIRDQVDLLGLSGIGEPDAVSQQNVLDIIYRQKELNFVPGDKWSYNNSGYILLAEIIRKVSGESLKEYSKKHIFLPFNMTGSFINDNAQDIVPSKAYSYEKDTVPATYLKRELNYSFYGPTNMNSTAKDLAEWLINFDKNNAGDNSIPGKMAQRAILNKGDTVFYGSGFFVDKYRKFRRIYHDGNDAGFETFVGYFPEKRLGIVVLANMLDSDPTTKAMRIANKYLPQPARTQNAVQMPPVKYQYVPANQAYLPLYAGSYETPGGNLLKVKAADTVLQIQFPDLDKPQELKAINDTVFHVFDDMLITFSKKQKTGFNQIALKRPTFSNTAHRVEYMTYNEQVFKEYLGTYYSEEIQAVYDVKLVNNSLVMTNIMNGNVALIPKTKDRFAAEKFYVNRVVFQRDKNDRVTSFLVSSDRMKNVRFVRMNSL